LEILIAHWPLLIGLVAAGLFAGLIAGLFGIGGGVVIVPVLAYMFSALGYPETAMHAAVGCSLATIVATSIRSAMAHNREGAVDWSVVRGWVPWIIVGALVGSTIAGLMPGEALKGVFGAVALIVAAQFAFGGPSWWLAPDLPTGPPKFAIAGVLGALSSIMGIGGGVFGVTLMTLCGRTIHQAVGTAAAFGAAIGLPGALGFAVSGWEMAGRAPFSIGYLNVPAIIIIALLTTSVAPIGARLAHRMDGPVLKRLFALALTLVALNMVREAIWA
jgi:uncharacterized membrane protein YfcA